MSVRKLDEDIRKILFASLKERLSDEEFSEFRDLKGMAYFDLVFGPYTQGDFAEEDPKRKTLYPGFGEACARLRELLDALPGRLWVDIDGEWCADEEPLCGECSGRGGDCDSCGGSGCDIGLEMGTVYQLDSREARRILLGGDLAGYV